GKTIAFTRGATTSEAVQIDHVVALANAWQTGAQGWDAAKRTAFANDQRELLAVDGPLNEQKGSGDAATWLPPDTSYRCAYVARAGPQASACSCTGAGSRPCSYGQLQGGSVLQAGGRGQDHHRKQRADHHVHRLEQRRAPALVRGIRQSALAEWPSPTLGGGL